MERASNPFELGDDASWSERSEFWRTYREPAKPGRPKKFKPREPLVLCGHGAHIRVQNTSLLVRNGFTHYPQDRQEFRFFPGDADLPNRIVMIDGSGGITFDALSWMADQKIEFVKLDWRGEVSSFGGQTGFSANPKLVEWQRKVRGSSKEIEIARNLIREKVSNSIQTLLQAIPKSANRDIAISRLNSRLSEIKSPKANSISRFLGIEGGAAASYFQGWQGIPLNWKGTGRKPIPDSWREIGPRKMGWRRTGQNPRHPINAMLNYGYGILKHQIRSQVISAGFDPTIGILHGNSQNRIPLIYDLMEPYRPVADRAILQFALSHTFAPGDFTINEWGGCRLNPQLAVRFVNQVISSFEPLGVGLLPM